MSEQRECHSHAEFSRFVQEATEQRRRAEAAEAWAARWKAAAIEQRRLYHAAVERGCSDRDFWISQARRVEAEATALRAELGRAVSAGDALEDAGQRLYAYIVRSHGSGKPGAPAFFDVLDAGLDAAQDFSAAQDRWRALRAAGGEEVKS